MLSACGCMAHSLPVSAHNLAYPGWAPCRMVHLSLHACDVAVRALRNASQFRVESAKNRPGAILAFTDRP